MEPVYEEVAQDPEFASIQFYTVNGRDCDAPGIVKELTDQQITGYPFLMFMNEKGYLDKQSGFAKQEEFEQTISTIFFNKDYRSDAFTHGKKEADDVKIQDVCSGNNGTSGYATNGNACSGSFHNGEEGAGAVGNCDTDLVCIFYPTDTGQAHNWGPDLYPALSSMLGVCRSYNGSLEFVYAVTPGQPCFWQGGGDSGNCGSDFVCLTLQHDGVDSTITYSSSGTYNMSSFNPGVEEGYSLVVAPGPTTEDSTSCGFMTYVPTGLCFPTAEITTASSMSGGVVTTTETVGTSYNYETFSTSGETDTTGSTSYCGKANNYCVGAQDGTLGTCCSGYCMDGSAPAAYQVIGICATTTTSCNSPSECPTGYDCVGEVNGEAVTITSSSQGLTGYCYLPDTCGANSQACIGATADTGTVGSCCPYTESDSNSPNNGQSINCIIKPTNDSNPIAFASDSQVGYCTFCAGLNTACTGVTGNSVGNCCPTANTYCVSGSGTGGYANGGDPGTCSNALIPGGGACYASPSPSTSNAGNCSVGYFCGSSSTLAITTPGAPGTCEACVAQKGTCSGTTGIDQGNCCSGYNCTVSSTSASIAPQSTTTYGVCTANTCSQEYAVCTGNGTDSQGNCCSGYVCTTTATSYDVAGIGSNGVCTTNACSDSSAACIGLSTGSQGDCCNSFDYCTVSLTSATAAGDNGVGYCTTNTCSQSQAVCTGASGTTQGNCCSGSGLVCTASLTSFATVANGVQGYCTTNVCSGSNDACTGSTGTTQGDCCSGYICTASPTSATPVGSNDVGYCTTNVCSSYEAVCTGVSNSTKGNCCSGYVCTESLTSDQVVGNGEQGYCTTNVCIDSGYTCAGGGSDDPQGNCCHGLVCTESLYSDKIVANGADGVCTTNACVESGACTGDGTGNGNCCNSICATSSQSTTPQTKGDPGSCSTVSCTYEGSTCMPATTNNQGNCCTGYMCATSNTYTSTTAALAATDTNGTCSPYCITNGKYCVGVEGYSQGNCCSGFSCNTTSTSTTPVLGGATGYCVAS